jgi:radical SAM superfamily enzyme YgiQ (UPF0313 family)
MRIAMVALSGVRVRSAELQALGVTLPGFVERGRVIASLPSLGLLTLAGATPTDVEVRYHEQGDVTAAELADAGTDVVALSTFTAQAPEAYAFADQCRALGLRVALGGLHASVRPEEAARHADHVFVGEGETTWPEFLMDLATGRPRRIYDARGRVFDLARSPRPRYELLDPQRYNRLTIQTTRSCPHRCTFCASGILLRGPYRKKPLELVERDLEAIERLWPRPFLELADDNTFVDRRWGAELLRTLAAHRVRWFTETDVSVADDPGFLALLAESGCRQLLIGLEDLERAAVAELEQRPFKACRVADYARAVAAIQEAGISVNGTFILGADHHTPEVFARVVRFAEDVGLAEVQVTVLTPFPGTPLRERLEREGRLLAPADWASCTLFDVTFRPARMSVRELEEGLRGTFRALYGPGRVRARRRRFHEQVRRGRRAGRAARATPA